MIRSRWCNVDDNSDTENDNDDDEDDEDNDDGIVAVAKEVTK